MAGPARQRVDHDFSVTGKVVRAPGPNVSVADIGSKWTDIYAGPVDGDRLLWQLGPMIYDSVRAGQRSVDVKIPTVRDHLDEPRESLSVRFDLNGKRVTKTIHVTSR